MLPRMISHPIEPLTFTFFTALATTIAVGGVSTVNFALDYQVVPVSLIGISFSLAVFPTLSTAYADADQVAFREVLGRNVVTIGILTTFAGIALFIGAPILVEVLLGGGEFGPEDVAITATIVAAFAVSVPFDSLAYPALPRPVRHPRHDPPGRRFIGRVRRGRSHRPPARAERWACCRSRSATRSG